MSIQRLSHDYLRNEVTFDDDGAFVYYAHHVAQVERLHAACIAAVEEFFRMPTDEQISEWVDTYGEAEWFEQACLAALREVQP